MSLYFESRHSEDNCFILVTILANTASSLVDSVSYTTIQSAPLSRCGCNTDSDFTKRYLRLMKRWENIPTTTGSDASFIYHFSSQGTARFCPALVKASTLFAFVKNHASKYLLPTTKCVDSHRSILDLKFSFQFQVILFSSVISINSRTITVE